MKQFWKTKNSFASSFYVWKIPLFLLIPALVVLTLAISLPLILLKKKAPRLETLCKPEAPENHWRYIVLHHSATHEGSAARFDTFHREVRGWENGLGYHFVIGNGTDSGDGEIEVGKRWKKQLSGAHAGDPRYNRMGIGICLVGNFEEGDRPSRRQIKSLINIIRYLSQRYDIPRSSIILHKDVHDTACPGKNFPYKKVMKSLRYLASGEAREKRKDSSRDRPLGLSVSPGLPISDRAKVENPESPLHPKHGGLPAFVGMMPSFGRALSLQSTTPGRG